YFLLYPLVITLQDWSVNHVRNLKCQPCMEAAQLITIIGGALIVILTSIFAFTPNSVNPSSIPALKSYALSIINNERSLRQGADISTDSQQIETALSVITRP
ncbi:MAG: hypothetical protein WAM42_07955, partial [Candidatus Nitrosopolaris sp.]